MFGAQGYYQRVLSFGTSENSFYMLNLLSGVTSTHLGYLVSAVLVHSASFFSPRLFGTKTIKSVINTSESEVFACVSDEVCFALV